MKKLFFLFALLASVVASATVTVTPLSTDFTAQKVTFKVEYSAAHNNRAWIWIDLCSVTGVTPTTFQTAVISAASATSGSVLYASTNTRGFFVTASPATVTATLSNASGKFNWCAHGSDYPPNATMNNGTYTLKGTPPFTINTTITENGKSYSGNCITALTDKTGCPGIIDNNFSAGSITTASYNSCNNTAGTATTVAAAPAGSGSYSYQWTVSYNGGTAATVSGATLATYTPPATATAGTYRYMRQVKDGLCNTTFTNSAGTVTRTVYTTLAAGAINTSSATVIANGTAPASITSSTNASGGSGGRTYRWVRSGTSSATYSVNNAGHSFTAAEINTAGTWTYYREVRDNTCATTTWIRSSGSYVLTVISCPYTGSDLYLDATHLCQQRSSGAQNWEAWIKDSRDNKLYRIVYMPDNKWWLAQNVRYASTGYSVSVSGCTDEICGRFYTAEQFAAAYGGSSGYGTNIQGVCPSGWVLPTSSRWQTLSTALGSSEAIRSQRIRPLNSTCSPVTDYYGFATAIAFLHSPNGAENASGWRANDTGCTLFRVDHVNITGDVCNRIEVYQCKGDTEKRDWTVRCFRNL